MARPKSEEKKTQLLRAAAEAVAEHGVGAPTALIAKLAGVAEGTLFRYFATKEELLNALYLHVWSDLCAAVGKSLVSSESLQRRSFAFWNAYIDWGLAHPAYQRARHQLAVTEILTEATRKAEALLFPDVGMFEACGESDVFGENPPEFGDAIFIALADATIDFARKDPARAEQYKLGGFNAQWRVFFA
jgi:AcrR family transcriptional regulator